MALYSYIKTKPKRERKMIALLSYSSLIAGCLFLFWSFYPIIFFQIYAQVYLKKKITTPIANQSALTSLINSNAVLGSYSILSTNLSDYTKAGIWFPSVAQEKNNDIKINEYTLSIPRLNIKNAKVIVGGADLNKGLIHYIPRTLPGQYGNVAIFGHSILPQLAKRGNDYKSIFTYLPSMEKGDSIYVNVEGVVYEYTVVDMFVVSPREISVLDQIYDDSYIHLVTCVPPGTYSQRLVVKAKLKKL